MTCPGAAHAPGNYVALKARNAPSIMTAKTACPTNKMENQSKATDRTAGRDD